MYNFTEYCDNYSDTLGSLWQFKRDERDNNVNVNVGNSSLFIYKSDFIGNLVADGIVTNVKIAVPLNYLCNFWRSLAMSLINCKVELSLIWGEKCILSGIEDAAGTTGTAANFKITDTKLYVPVAALLIEDNIKLTKQLNDRFKRSVNWNKYKMVPNNAKEPPKNGTSYIREFLDASYQGVKRLFIKLILIKNIFFQE